MPVSDPRRVARLEDAFDLSTPSIVQWELELIWVAVLAGLVRFDDHAQQAITDETIAPQHIFRIILTTSRRSKNIGREQGRQIGINFDGKDGHGRVVRAKVSWFGGYVIVTAHTL